MGDRRPEDRRGHRAGPPGGDQGRAGLHRDQGAVHPPGHQRGPPGRRPRPGRHRVHPPRLPRRRPGPAHPRRGREQGPDPRRQVAGHRRPAAATRPRSRPRRPTTPRSSGTWSTRSGCGSRSARTPDARKRPVREIVGVDPDLNHRFSKRRRQRRGPPQGARRRRSRRPTAARRRRSRRCSWPSRPPWRPARPSTSRARWPSSGRPGTARRSRSSAHRAAAPADAPRRTQPDRRRQPPRSPTRRGSPRPPTGSWRRWRAAAPPGSTGTSTPRPSARCGPPNVPTDQVAPGRRPAGQRGPRRPLGEHRPARRRDRRAGRAAPRRRLLGLHRRRRPTCSPRARSWPPKQRLVERRRPPRRVRRRRVRSVDLALLESDRQRGHPQRRPGHPGAGDGHLRRPAAAGDRARRIGQDHRDAGARPAPGPTAAAPSSASPRRPRPPTRSSSMGSQIDTQTDTLAKLTHSLEQPGPAPRAGLGRRHRPPDARGDRRGRHGRHALPGHRRAATSSSAAAASG